MVPWLCQNVIRSGGATSREVCGFDLRDAEPTRLGTGHPLLATQAWIDGVIGSPGRPSSATTHVCGIDVPRIETLCALSQLVRRMVLLRVDTTDAVTHNLGTPRRITTGVTPPPGDAPAQSVLAATVACAARFGEAATMAVDCLAAPTQARAAHEMARYADLALSKTPREDMTDGAADWRSDTPRLQTRHRAGLIDAIDLAGQDLTPSDQLTFRLHNRIPRRPLPSTIALPTWPHIALTGLTARHIPQRLWPNVIAALPQSTHKDTGAFPTVAAMMLARIGTYTRWGPIALQMALPSTFARTPQSVMARLIDNDMFAETALVLDALRECLDDSPPPIDYARRRWIFRKLIDPGRGWRQACRDADLVATDRRRMFLGHALFELLTGSDARFRTHQSLPAGEIRVAYKHFLALEAGALHEFLRHKAESLLLRHRIDEPIQWAPTFDYDDGWRSPTPDLERSLPGWTSPSRTDTLRQSSRDHTTQQVLDAFTTGGHLDHILTDIIAHQRTGTLVHGPSLDVAIAGLYQVTHQQWTLGAVGSELQGHLVHTFGSTIDLDLWEPRAHAPTQIVPQERPA
ncbi:hypothetical protein Gbro_4714 [Gordonia bronchialis DSM 43247]|uniref:Uncharacterized protein n=1 Tax=Gordonia bronchialis (strain ATCC 25592 / DSM 43247 / BCRC 13721 / JCM 3198 / KCTC 3076 / NBRC 16047 / NCTC 10667) TaxID=526226 RepID=D0L887_GORB4|nr:hypothetical protein [Gordonia bronchialis]ACY23835.1 hypothetical protein Gbro_4714 [Gordonia bronchialis DSM 43247]MCC3321999.1 hypothetical protein [Gordonia bronchialis]QGS22859.1 hypothetical protein FOB84_00275 [Gordonia bronchialis]STQ66858.1 Uncharacterised protein [Gordonia bronchialis]